MKLPSTSTRSSGSYAPTSRYRSSSWSNPWSASRVNVMWRRVRPSSVRPRRRTGRRHRLPHVSACRHPMWAVARLAPKRQPHVGPHRSMEGSPMRVRSRSCHATASISGELPRIHTHPRFGPPGVWDMFVSLSRHYKRFSEPVKRGRLARSLRGPGVGQVRERARPCRSSFDWHSIQCVARGWARSRFSAMGLPHISHSP
jgi:hypothetical protein